MNFKHLQLSKIDFLFLKLICFSLPFDWCKNQGASFLGSGDSVVFFKFLLVFHDSNFNLNFRHFKLSQSNIAVVIFYAFWTPNRLVQKSKRYLLPFSRQLFQIHFFKKKIFKPLYLSYQWSYGFEILTRIQSHPKLSFISKESRSEDTDSYKFFGLFHLWQNSKIPKL